MVKINFRRRRSTLITIASRVSLPLSEVYTLARASTCIIYKMCSCLHLLQSGKRRGSGYHGSYKNGQESMERFCVRYRLLLFTSLSCDLEGQKRARHNTPEAQNLLMKKKYIYIGNNCQWYWVNFKEVN